MQYNEKKNMILLRFLRFMYVPSSRSLIPVINLLFDSTFPYFLSQLAVHIFFAIFTNVLNNTVIKCGNGRHIQREG